VVSEIKHAAERAAHHSSFTECIQMYATGKVNSVYLIYYNSSNIKRNYYNITLKHDTVFHPQFVPSMPKFNAPPNMGRTPILKCYSET